MIQRIWAAIAATLAVVAVFVVLAVSQRPPTVAGTSVVMTRTASGQLVPVANGSNGVHATTSSSTVAAGGQAVTYVKTANGNLVPITSSTSAGAVTRSS